jgi:hypothetical protein
MAAVIDEIAQLNLEVGLCNEWMAFMAAPMLLQDGFHLETMRRRDYWHDQDNNGVSFGASALDIRNWAPRMRILSFPSERQSVLVQSGRQS